MGLREGQLALRHGCLNQAGHPIPAQGAVATLTEIPLQLLGGQASPIKQRLQSGTGDLSLGASPQQDIPSRRKAQRARPAGALQAQVAALIQALRA